MKWLVPASYEFYGDVKVDAETPEEAVKVVLAMTCGQIYDAIRASGASVDVYVEEGVDHVEEAGEEDDN